MTESFHLPGLGLAVKLGRVVPSSKPRVMLPFADYLGALPAPPTSIQWGTKVPVFPMYANDEYGDCTCAAVGHQIQVWTSNQGQIFTPTRAAILNAYWKTGDGTDDGRMETDVLNYWHNTGISGHKVQGYASVNPQNIREVKQAVSLFGGLYIGIALPLSAKIQTFWKVVTGADSAPGSWGGHAVNITAYTSNYLVCVTWGMRMKMTWAFWQKYVDEAYAAVSLDWIKSSGLSASGYNIAQLSSDLGQLSGTVSHLS